MRQVLSGILASLAGWVGLAGPAACSSAPPGVELSGFLGDYSQLREGRGDQAQLIYIDSAADFSGYERMLVDPVVVWTGSGSLSSDVSEQELQRLADHLGAALREQLQLEFDLVESPSPGTLRLRSAITAVRASGASVELEVLDAASGKRLVAVADAHGGKQGRDPRTDASAGSAHSAGSAKWANVEEAFDYWAQRARVRLAAFRDFDAAEAAHAAGGKP